MNAKNKPYVFYADYEGVEELIEGFIRAIEMLGGNVYESPRCQGSDTYGFIVSKKKLTPEQLKECDDLGLDEE